MQTDSEIQIHQIENNPESTQHLQVYEGKFAKKCAELLRRLVTGERLEFAKEVNKIGDLRRRSLDLITLNGGTTDKPTIPVQRTFNGEIKQYWLKEEDIAWIRVKYKKII